MDKWRHFFVLSIFFGLGLGYEMSFLAIFLDNELSWLIDIVIKKKKKKLCVSKASKMYTIIYVKNYMKI